MLRSPRLLLKLSYSAGFLITLQPLITSLPADAVVPTQFTETPAPPTGFNHELQPLFHHTFRFPRHLRAPPSRSLLILSTVNYVMIGKCQRCHDTEHRARLGLSSGRCSAASLLF